MVYAVGFIRISLWIVGLAWLTKTVVKPGPDDPLRWHDRTSRAIGVVLLLALLTFGIPRWLGWHQ
jgi:hypothetical protein